MAWTGPFHLGDECLVRRGGGAEGRRGDTISLVEVAVRNRRWPGPERPLPCDSNE